MEWSLEAIASSLRLEFEEGYNDRYTFTLTDNKLSVDDLHLGVNVCTIEPYGEGYILHPHEKTVDAIVLDGTDESPWLLANQFVDLYDTEHPVSQEMYVAYLEHKVEQLEALLSDKQSELVAMDILKTNKDTEITALKEENALLVSERDSLFHDTEAYKQVIRYQDEELRIMKKDSQVELKMFKECPEIVKKKWRIEMSDKEQQLLDLFEKHKKDLDGGRLEALFEFTEECEKELKQSSKYGKITTAIMHSYIRSAYEVGRKRAEDYYKALRKDEEERRFHITCEETPPDGELVYCVGKDHCTQKELSGIYFYHSGYWWTDEQRKSDECWWDGTGINDYVFYKWMKLPKD